MPICLHADFNFFCLSKRLRIRNSPDGKLSYLPVADIWYCFQRSDTNGLETEDRSNPISDNLGLHGVFSESTIANSDANEITNDFLASFGLRNGALNSNPNSSDADEQYESALLNAFPQKIYDLIDSNSNNVITNSLQHMDVTYFAPQQLRIISDLLNMLEPKYQLMYNQMEAEKKLHQDYFVAAYHDLQNAMNIMSAKSQDGDNDYSIQHAKKRLLEAKDHILSAVRNLQDSCPICRALKYAVNNAENRLLPIITSACISILKSLHPSELQTPST